ncbi:glycine-rich cell wall structural protein 2-like [Cannabis sativa]|uniref:glycine-rich cell wall structural protein 2-like n=1 Tax=Cannabis sativa TaxID=3483 RepID=UPI0029C9DC11|nr:glycine-rich cell wall structural protein 2-like [Cannabis sativa]
MSIHSTRRVTISVVILFVLLGLVIGTYASRALLDNDGLNSGAAAAYGSGINGATQYGVGGGIGGAGATGGEYGGGGMGGGEGEAGGSGGSSSGGSSIGFAAKEEYATNNRGGGLQ